jgi:hypothetical protein
LTAAGPGGKTAARRITDGLEPKNWIIAVTVLIGWKADQLTGIGWGLLGALFAAVLPTAFIRYGMRKGRWADRNVGARRHRLIVMTFIIASVTLGVTLLAVLGAPRPVLALIVAMLTTMAVLMAITTVWKISVHCAVSAGAVAMLALAYGPLMLTGYALVALVGWSRAELKDHTPAQAAAGAALGTLTAALTYRALR